MTGIDADGRKSKRIISAIARSAARWGPTCVTCAKCFTHIHDQEIEISEGFYLDRWT
jgi:hypothetical protein